MSALIVIVVRAGSEHMGTHVRRGNLGPGELREKCVQNLELVAWHEPCV